MCETVEILIAARELISDPEKWTREAYARDENGGLVHEKSPYAVCFSALGAIYQVSPRLEYGNSAVKVLNRYKDNITIGMVNDIEGHEAVLRMFDRAIKANS